MFQGIVDQGVDPLDLMAAMARMINGTAEPFSDRRQHHPTRSAGKQNSARLAAATQTSKGTGGRRYSMGVGHRHGATPARILAIVAKASGLKGKQIGKIAIGQHDSIVDLPDYLPAAALKSLRKVRMNGHPLLPSEM